MAKKSGGGHYRSAISGRYVTTPHGQRSPRTTVREAASSGGLSGGVSNRSAASGRYVTAEHAKRSPNTTVRETN